MLFIKSSYHLGILCHLFSESEKLSCRQLFQFHLSMVYCLWSVDVVPRGRDGREVSWEGDAPLVYPERGAWPRQTHAPPADCHGLHQQGS